MSTSVNSRIAFSSALERLALVLPSHDDLLHSYEYTSIYQSYRVEFALDSGPASILFLQDQNAHRRIVVKILCKYTDSRYSFNTTAERQQCQLEALYWNQKFTPSAYRGLTRIYGLDLQQAKIYIGKIISSPAREKLNLQAEYGLVIDELPQEKRLDYLLEKNREHEVVLSRYAELLAQRIAHMHEHITPPVTHPAEEGIRWGSIEQLRDKLTHNLSFSEFILRKIGSEHSSFYHTYIDEINSTLCNTLEDRRFQKYFELRMQQQYIRRCHGDLKTPNIWIAHSKGQPDEQLDEYVWILDAVDFKSMYSNIDILSDVATLVVDIQARTKSPSIAGYFRDRYLELSRQQDPVSSSILSYYLVEKAFVGAILAIIYDDLPDLGFSFLEVARTYLEESKPGYSSSPSLLAR